MHKIILSIFAALIFSSLLSGQRTRTPGMYIEGGAGTNLSYFDVGGGSPGVSVQGSALFELHPSWRLGANVGFHRTRGTDEGTANASREYEFKSNLNEISVKGIYVVRFKQRQQKKWKKRLKPRAFLSLGVVQIQPIHNQNLAANGTEEGLNVAPLFSGGIGLGYALNRNLSLVIEGGTNGSTSDFLEGYTNLLNSDSPDLFHTLFIKAVYKVPSGWD